MAWAAVRSEADVLLLLIYCLLLLPLFVGVICLALVLLCSTLCHSSFAIILMGKSELIVYFNCHPDVLVQSLFCGSSARCRGLVCSV